MCTALPTMNDHHNERSATMNSTTVNNQPQCPTTERRRETTSAQHRYKLTLCTAGHPNRSFRPARVVRVLLHALHVRRVHHCACPTVPAAGQRLVLCSRDPGEVLRDHQLQVLHSRLANAAAVGRGRQQGQRRKAGGGGGSVGFVDGGRRWRRSGSSRAKHHMGRSGSLRGRVVGSNCGARVLSCARVFIRGARGCSRGRMCAWRVGWFASVSAASTVSTSASRTQRRHTHASSCTETRPRLRTARTSTWQRVRAGGVKMAQAALVCRRSPAVGAHTAALKQAAE